MLFRSGVRAIFFSGSGAIVQQDNFGILLRSEMGTSVVNYANNRYNTIRASAFDIPSSRRYKENIKEMSTTTSSKIYDLNVVTFDYNKDSKMLGKNVAGLIAEDTIKILPEVVTVRTINGELKPDAIDYSKLVPYLLKEIQELRKEINELKEAKN